MHKNAFAAGAPPQTHTGALTALPRPLAGFWGRERTVGRKGLGKGKGRGWCDLGRRLLHGAEWDGCPW